MEQPTIRILASKCQREFAALISASSELVARREVSLLHERFEQWAGNLGAFQDPESHLSLEYRLRDAASVSRRIFDILKNLFDSLHAGMIGNRVLLRR